MADKTEKKPGFVARAKAAVKNFFGKCAKFFRDTKSELKKVVWPSKEDTKQNTVVVLVTVALAAVVMILLDTVFGGDLAEAVRALVSESGCGQSELEQAMAVLAEKHAEAEEYDLYDPYG